MEWLGWLALIFLTLVGYCGGAVVAAQAASPRPAARDLLAILLAWIAASGARLGLALNHWIALLVGVAIGAVLGWTFGRLSRAKAVAARGEQEEPSPFFTRFVQRWKRFSARLGDFQSRVLLSYFYFVVVLPFGLLARWGLDPLQLRRRAARSHWGERPTNGRTIDDARSQF